MNRRRCLCGHREFSHSPRDGSCLILLPHPDGSVTACDCKAYQPASSSGRDTREEDALRINPSPAVEWRDRAPEHSGRGPVLPSDFQTWERWARVEWLLGAALEEIHKEDDDG